jgi:hypothetical protein
MKTRRIDMTGLRFGRLVGISFVGTGSDGRTRWLFKCDCGKQHEANGKDVRCGRTKSCGCLQSENRLYSCKTHGMSLTLEHGRWSDCINRCHNPKNKAFKNYGARGIAVCEEWRNSFEQFYSDMGPIPARHLTLERKNNDLGYSKDNCVWATRNDQGRNRRGVVMSIKLAKEAKAVRDSGGDLTAWARAQKLNRVTVWFAAVGKTWND